MSESPRVRTTLMLVLLVVVVVLVFGVMGHLKAQTKAEKPFVVEYYYKVKWGHAEEFLTLFEKNHYPILKKEVEMGRMLSVSAVRPVYHSTEEGRWDYRMTIVYKNVDAAYDSTGSEELVKKLYPDQATFEKEEQRRFELLEAHWDVPVASVNLDKK